MKVRESSPFEKLVRFCCAAAGLLLVAIGAAWIYPPAGLIALGVGLMLDAAPERKPE